MPDTPLPADVLHEAPAPEESSVQTSAVEEAAANATSATSATSTTALIADAPAAEVAPAPAPSAPELSLALCAARLAELFPALFAPPVKPLKLRIQADLQERAPGVFTRKVLSVFLHRHTTSTAYLKALVHLGQRFDLDGAPCGDITAEHRDAAVAEMARRRGVFDARREAERQAQRDAEKAQRDAHLAQERQRREADAAQDQQRRDRLGLLRAWETSTLTRANFCALKGIAQADLDAQLALARDDAAQRAAMPQPGWAPADQPRPYDGPREARDTRDTRGNIRPEQARPGAPRQSPDQRGARPPRSSRPPRSGGGGNEPSA